MGNKQKKSSPATLTESQKLIARLLSLAGKQTDKQCAGSKADYILAGGEKKEPTERKDKSIAPLKAWQ